MLETRQIDFVLPDEAAAGAPPEAEGRRRDDVRLLVIDRAAGRWRHARFVDLPRFLRAGDLLVFNVSQTVPAALGARRERDSASVRLHFSTRLDGYDNRFGTLPERWVVEVRQADGSPLPGGHARPGDSFVIEPGARVELLEPHRGSRRYWVAAVSAPAFELMARLGQPVRYGYVSGPWPLAVYQTEVGEVPGSAEMPSAARPFTGRIRWALRQAGVEFTGVLLHTGLSSEEVEGDHVGPDAVYPEWFAVPPSAAAQVSRALREGRRVIAVGTTVVRALESAPAGSDGIVAAEGWTHLFVSPDRPPQVVRGLVTGLHAPRSTHLAMLAAFVPPELVRAAYADALRVGYRWHEFGDLCLIL